jgi:hypothetical protein
MCIEFKLLKVKVPIIFLGTAGFSLRRDGRYAFSLGEILPQAEGIQPTHRRVLSSCLLYGVKLRHRTQYKKATFTPSLTNLSIWTYDRLLVSKW